MTSAGIAIELAPEMSACNFDNRPGAENRLAWHRGLICRQLSRRCLPALRKPIAAALSHIHTNGRGSRRIWLYFENLQEFESLLIVSSGYFARHKC